MKVKKNQIKIILFLLFSIFLVNIDLENEEINSSIIEYPNKVITNSEGEQYINQRYTKMYKDYNMINTPDYDSICV